MIGVLVKNTYSERAYFSLFNDVYIILIGKYFRKLRFFNDFFQFYFLNSDVSVTLHAIKMIFSVSLLKGLLEGSVSQIFDIDPRYHFMSKIG